MSKIGRPQIKKMDLLRQIQVLTNGLLALKAEVDELKAKLPKELHDDPASSQSQADS